MTSPSETTALAPSRLATLWRTAREAVRGAHHHDYTEGSIGRALVLLAVPMVLEMVMESIFAVADVFWVAHLGPAAVATVGLTESLMIVVYTLAMGLSIGATAMVARRIGEHDRERAAVTAVQVVALGALVATVLGIAGALQASHLLALMGGDAALVRTGHRFTQLMLGGNISVFLLFLVNAVLRGSGDAAGAMRALWVANAINIVLGPLLIFGPGPLPAFGVTGAAMATVFGRSVGVAVAASRLVRPGGRLAVARRHLRLVPRVMASLVRLSGAATFQVLVGSASWIALVRIISQYGDDALAGYTIAMRLVTFALLPAWGLSNAAATMMGQSLGAKKPERARAAVWRAARYNLAFLGSVGLLFVLGAEPLLRFFTGDPAVLRYGTDALRTVALGFPCYAFGMVLTQAFNGAGDTRTPTLLNLAIFWAAEIPLAWVLAERVGLGPHGAFVAVALCFSVLAGVSALIFRQGRWATRVV